MMGKEISCFTSYCISQNTICTTEKDYLISRAHNVDAVTLLETSNSVVEVYNIASYSMSGAIIIENGQADLFD